jgi:2'-5' RNA ligase
MVNDGDRRSAPATHRLFVAAYPPPEVVAGLEALPREPAPGVRWVPPVQWHATLRFLGDADPAAVVAALGATTLPRATAELGPQVGRLGLGVLVVPVGGLDALAGAVVTATAELGAPPDPRPFSGHLTLARLRRGATCALIGTAAAGAFDVEEVCLVDSRSGPEGAVYEVLERFPLDPIGA